MKHIILGAGVAIAFAGNLRSGETPLRQPARRQRSGRKPLTFRPLGPVL